MFIHSFVVSNYPKGFLKDLNKDIWNFVWTRNIGSNKLVVVPWQSCYVSVKQGSLGIWNMFILNYALLGKLVCLLIQIIWCFVF